MAQFESVSVMEENFASSQYLTHCFQTASYPSSAIVISIPLYELLIYPCLRNQGPSILKSAGIGAAAVVAASFYGTMAEIARQAADGTTKCMFTQNSPNNSSFGDFVCIPFNYILGIANVLLVKPSIEFICAQAPYSMNGLLIGLSYTILTLFLVPGGLIVEAWRNKWFAILGTSTCGIWFYLTTLVLAVVSSALLGLVIRWYKARERDEITRSQDLVEEVYHKYMHHKQGSQE